MQNVNRIYQPFNGQMPFNAAKTIFPSWVSRNAIAVYFLALVGVSLMYSAYSLPWYYMLAGVVGILAFFLYGGKVIVDTSNIKIRREKAFEKRIFKIAFIPRILLLLLLYTIFQSVYGDAFGFGT